MVFSAQSCAAASGLLQLQCAKAAGPAVVGGNGFDVHVAKLNLTPRSDGFQEVVEGDRWTLHQ